MSKDKTTKAEYKQMASVLAEALRQAIAVIAAKEEMIRFMGGSSTTTAMFKRVLREYDDKCVPTLDLTEKTRRHHRDDCACSECKEGSYG